jgi:hypothetical protein
MISIEYNDKNKELIIKSTKHIDDFSELMDKLGDLDVVQANEIEQNYIAFDGMVYELDDLAISRLSEEGEIGLTYLGEVRELADEDFIKWYY